MSKQEAEDKKTKPPCSAFSCSNTSVMGGYCHLHMPPWVRGPQPFMKPRSQRQRRKRARQSY